MLDGVFERTWLHKGLLALTLWPVSLVFGALGAARRWLYDAGILQVRAVPAVVVVVGNVVAGGAGKTPAVIAIVRHCQAQGWFVGVVSRGYGRSGTDCIEVFEHSPVGLVGDEPLLIKRKTGAPVVVGTIRAQAASALLAAHPATHIIVCDDGLQHYGLARDLEVCVFDDRGLGNSMLLPAGPLREPWPRRSTARWHPSLAPMPGQPSPDLILHSGRNPAFAGYRGARSLAADGILSDGTALPLTELPAGAVVAVAGIARPEAFFAMLRDRGLKLARTLALPDHHDFADWTRPVGGNYTLLCTEKDAPKLWPVEPAAVAVPLLFTPEPAFFAAFDQRVTALLDARLSSADGCTST